MSAATGLVVIKKFNYRGDAEETWSNKYWLTGAPPQLATEWETLFHQLAQAESNVLGIATEIVGGYAYNDNDPNAHSVWSTDLEALGATIPGLVAVTAANKLAGDQAACLEWRTQRKNSRGKWVYLRKYFHGGPTQDLDADYIDVTWLNALENFGNILMNGTGPMFRKIRSQGRDEDLSLVHVIPYTTTRSLKRRGKRPS